MRCLRVARPAGAGARRGAPAAAVAAGRPKSECARRIRQFQITRAAGGRHGADGGGVQPFLSGAGCSFGAARGARVRTEQMGWAPAEAAKDHIQGPSKTRADCRGAPAAGPPPPRAGCGAGGRRRPPETSLPKLRPSAAPRGRGRRRRAAAAASRRRGFGGGGGVVPVM
ncbi:MAG: hypothetical protein J3K34DRAFT_433044, partial [Monoraphidium minutum]